MAMVGRAGPVSQGPPTGGDQLQRGPWLGRGAGAGAKSPGLGWGPWAGQDPGATAEAGQGCEGGWCPQGPDGELTGFTQG